MKAKMVLVVVVALGMLIPAGLLSAGAQPRSEDREERKARAESGVMLETMPHTSVENGALPDEPGQILSAEALNVDLIAQVGGWTQAVAVKGGYAYIGVGPAVGRDGQS